MRIGALCLPLLVLAAGCGTRHSTQPNVILVAVEGLGFDQVPCDEESLAKGFAVMCGESIRFTHSYTNSTTSLANLGTLLTARLPEDHGLRGQAQWMRASQRLASEVALEKGYRTAFISGGPPVSSKSGLGQGFETFDDRVALDQRPYYRTARKTVGQFVNWRVEEVGSAPFFSVLYMPDSLFPFEASQNREGELRELSVSSKFLDVADALEDLADELKSNRIWNNTYVIVVGLGGGQHPANLRSEQTQVTLLIKPPRAQKDQATQWGVDHNVSLVDVGFTLFGVLGGEPLSRGDRYVPTSLNEVLTQAQPKWSRDRWIPTESYWGFELFGLDVVRAVRRDHLLYVNGPVPLLYNTLMDRMESNPTRLRGETEEVLAQLGAPTQEGHVPTWFQMGVDFFRFGADQVAWSLNDHPFTHPWRVRSDIETGNWAQLADFSARIQRLDLEILAKSKLKVRLPRVSRNQCESIFIMPWKDVSLDQLRDVCKADRLIFYRDWADAKGSDNELVFENRFRQSFQNWWSRLELGAINYASQGTLGLPLTWPQMPDLTETYLIFREKKVNRVLIRTQGSY